jgi:hypothetical protein
MDEFDISFGMPVHGWIQVDISIPGRTYEFAASYVLCDPVSDLATACLDLINGAEAAMVRLWLEPRWSILDLTRCSTAKTLVRFRYSANDDGENPESLISTIIDTLGFCRLVAKRIRKMYDATGTTCYSSVECAGRMFPDATVSNIHDLVRHRRGHK